MKKKLISDTTSAISLKKDANGFFVFDGIAARTGIYEYLENDQVIKVFISDTILNDEISNAGLAGLPILVGHTAVTPATAKSLSVGSVYGLPEFANDQLNIKGKIISDEGIDAVEKGGYKQLSPSYYADNIKQDGDYKGEKYTHVQTKRTYNHLALVKAARGGDQCSIIFDSIDEKEEVKLIKYKFKGMNLSFDSQEDLDAFKKEMKAKNDEVDIEALQSQLTEMQALIAEQSAKLAEIEGDDAKAQAIAEMEKTIAERLQAILEAMQMNPDAVTSDSVRNKTSAEIKAMALGLTFDAKKHTDDYLDGALDIAKKNAKSRKAADIDNSKGKITQSDAHAKIYGKK